MNFSGETQLDSIIMMILFFVSRICFFVGEVVAAALMLRRFANQCCGGCTKVRQSSVVALNWRRVALNEKLTSKTQKRFCAFRVKLQRHHRSSCTFLYGFDLRRNKKYVSSLREKFSCVPSKSPKLLICVKVTLLDFYIM